MTVGEYRARFPEQAWKLDPSIRVDDPDGNGYWIKGRFYLYRGIMIACEDPNHKGSNPKKFVAAANLTGKPKDRDNWDGLYRCRVCGLVLANSNLGSEGRLSRSKKAWETKKGSN